MMSAVPLIVEVLLVFLVSAYLVYHYSDWRKQRFLVLAATFISWYFSMIIVFILPLDVSTTIYRQCIVDNEDHPLSAVTTELHNYNGSTSSIEMVTSRSDDNQSVFTLAHPDHSNQTEALLSLHQRSVDQTSCHEPYSYVSPKGLPYLWNVVYWTSQLLTWIILPFMKSFTKSGSFTLLGKVRSALIENAIVYGSYLLIFGVLLIYVAVNLQIDMEKLAIIGMTASNTWGLFVLVLMLGYSLVEVPRQLWQASYTKQALSHLYFEISKLSTEKSEAEENLEDTLDEIQQAAESLPHHHPQRKHLDTILQKCPEAFHNKVLRLEEFQDDREMPSEGRLTKLHKKVISALLNEQRTRTQWNRRLAKAMQLEDLEKNEKNEERVFRYTFTRSPQWYHWLYTPSVEWYWKVVVRPGLTRAWAILLALFSLVVIWSECTFFSNNPTLSIFALLIDACGFNYLLIELICDLTICYLCFCAYFTVFQIRVFNWYYLAPYHQTDEYSLLFSGMMLCRLTAPLCLNFLGLIHLDGHVTGDENMMETSYTSIMGQHMDVLPFMADGFYIYYPIVVVVLCVATYFSLGTRLLGCLGFQLFIGEDEMTFDLTEEGKELVKREKIRRQRTEEGEARRDNFHKRWGTSERAANSQRTFTEENSGNKSSKYGGRKGRVQPPGNRESDREELLKASDEVVEYTDNYQLSEFSAGPSAGYNKSSGSSTAIDGFKKPTFGSSRYSNHKKAKRGFFDDI